MICDVSDSLEVVTHLELLPKNATERNRRPHPPRGGPFRSPSHVELPPGWRGSLPGDIRGGFEVHIAGGWHDLAPGETRTQLDYTGFVTFYDSTLSSLVDPRQGKDRMHHRLEKNLEADAARIHAELQSVLMHKQGSGSSIDWKSISHIVVERYADRLEYLRFLLSSNASVAFMDAAEQALVVPCSAARHARAIYHNCGCPAGVRIGQRELASTDGASLCDDTDIEHSPGHAYATGGADTRGCGKYGS